MTFRLPARLLFVLSIAWLIASSSTAQTPRPMTVDDVLDLVQLSAPRISPDGTRVLYSVSELGKWKDNKRVTSIWLANTDGTGARLQHAPHHHVADLGRRNARARDGVTNHDRAEIRR